MLSIMVHFWRVAKRLKNSGVKPSTPAAVPELMSIMVSTTCSPVSIAEDFKFWWLWGGRTRLSFNKACMRRFSAGMLRCVLRLKMPPGLL